MQEFSDSKKATLTSSSFFTETNHLKLLLRKKQVPQVPSSQKTKYLKLLLHRKRRVTTSTLEHHDQQQQQLLLLQEQRMQKCDEDFEVHWQSKEQNGPTTSNPRNQEQHQEVWRLKTLLLGKNKRSSNDASGTHQHGCHFVLERGDDDQGFVSPSWWEACQTQPTRTREPLGPHFLQRTPPNSFQSRP